MRNVNVPPFDNKLVRQAPSNYGLNRTRSAETVLTGAASPLACHGISEPRQPTTQVRIVPMRSIWLKTKSVLDLGRQRPGWSWICSCRGRRNPRCISSLRFISKTCPRSASPRTSKNLDQATFSNDQVVNFSLTTEFRRRVTVALTVRPPALLTVSPWLESQPNCSGFARDDTYKQLVVSASAETDPTKQQQLYAQINDFVLDQSWVMPLSTNPITGISRSTVHDIGFWVHNGALRG